MEYKQLIIPPKYIDFYFSGHLSNIMGLDVEMAVAKKGVFGNNFKNIPVEISLSSDINNYECCFHSFIFQNPDIIHNYNTWITGIKKQTLRSAPNYNFVRKQIIKIFNEYSPLIIGCGIKNDLNCFNIEYENIFDIQSFFYEKNFSNTGYQPISLKRVVKKFFNTDIQNNLHDCITDSRYTIISYKEIILQWEKIKILYSMEDPPFENNIFPK